MSLLNNIANYLLSSKESAKGTKQFLNWSQITTVLIIAYDNQLSNCVDFINTCKKDNIQVHVAIIYDGKLAQVPKPNFDHTILDKKQFNFFDLPKTETLSQLNIKVFDVLINLCDSEKIKALALSKLVSAKCKIANFQNPIFEITIMNDITMNNSDFFKQLVVYLNMIKATK